MKRVIAAALVLMSVSTTWATVVYQDTFTSLGAYTLNGTPEISTEQAYDGLTSMKTTSSAQRARIQIPGTTDAFTYEFWMYDAGGARGFGQVTAYNNATWGGTLQQMFAIGKYNTTDLNMGSGAEAYMGTKYQARITNGIGATGGSWFNLSGAGNRSTGWHKFTVKVADDYSKVSFFVDDVLGREFNLQANGKPAAGFNWISYGLGAGSSAETFYYDKASLIAIPEPATMLFLALGGLFLRRRCR